MFQIQINEQRGTAHILISGFWDEATMESFERKLPEALRKLTLAGRSNSCIIDATQSVVQWPSIIARYGTLIRKLQRVLPDRIAVAASNPLVKMQWVRIGADRARFQTFPSVTEARAWIVAEGLAGSARARGSIPQASRISPSNALDARVEPARN